MKLGFSTSCLPRSGWNFVLNKLPSKVIEVNLSKSYLPFIEETLKEKIAPKLSAYDLSLHSRTHHLFSGNKLLADAEEKMLKADLYVAEIFGAKEVVFHIARDVKKVDFRLLETLVSEFPGKLLLENNNRGLFSPHQEILETLEKIPGLGFCLDWGHLKLAEKRGFVEDKFEFINLLRKHISYVHLHDNQGEYDSHSAFLLTEENEKFLELMKKISPGKLIIETRTWEDAIKTYESVKEYLKGKVHK
ncbi:MAG: sugar phosphate isomerase/epimerase [Nanoarchaeota archaeon]|nr:sugar phosphate isomerase/epimerase [Nanoarchaeota archaeon]